MATTTLRRRLLLPRAKIAAPAQAAGPARFTMPSEDRRLDTSAAAMLRRKGVNVGQIGVGRLGRLGSIGIARRG